MRGLLTTAHASPATGEALDSIFAEMEGSISPTDRLDVVAVRHSAYFHQTNVTVRYANIIFVKINSSKN